MSKNSSSKRKAKQTAQRTQNAQQAQMRALRIAEALIDVCEPFVDEFFEKRKFIAPNDWFELWRAGSYAWNLAVEGHNDVIDAFLDQHIAELGNTVFFANARKLMSKMIKRKNELYPQLRTEIKKVAAVPSSTGTRLKVTLGETHGKLQDSEDEEEKPIETEQEEIPAEITAEKQTPFVLKVPAATSMSNDREQGSPQETEETAKAKNADDIEAKLEQFNSLATKTQVLLKGIVSQLESQKVPSMEETNALDHNIEILRKEYDDFVAYAGDLLPKEEMPPEGSGLGEYRKAIENSTALILKRKMEEAREILGRFTRIRGKVAAYSNALKPYQDAAAELLGSLSEEKIHEIIPSTIAPKVFLDALEIEDIAGTEDNLDLIDELGTYYTARVYAGLVGHQYYEDTSIPLVPADAAKPSQEEAPAPAETERTPQESEEKTVIAEAPHTADVGAEETAATNVDAVPEDTPKKKAGKKRSSKKQNQGNETKTDLPAGEDANNAKVQDDKSVPESESDNTDISEVPAEKEAPSANGPKTKSPEEDIFADNASSNEPCKAEPLEGVDLRQYLEQREAPSDEEFCTLISKVINQPAETPKQVKSAIVQAVLLANGAELEEDRPDAGLYSSQLKLATHLLLGESPYSSENVTSVFPDPQNENKALLLSAYLFAMLNPSVSHDNTLWAEAKNYLSDYDTLFIGFGAFKQLFNKLIAVKDFELGFSQSVIASLGSAAEIDALIGKLRNAAKNYLVLQIPNIPIKLLPRLYGKCFGTGSALYNCMSIISEGKKDKKSIDVVEKNLAMYCDKQDDSFIINTSKVENILDSEWESIKKETKDKSTFKLDYKGRDQTIRQFTSRLELMRSWLEQMSYANKKEHLSRLRELKKNILDICDNILKDGSWKKESFSNILYWLLLYMKGYLKGEVTDLRIYSDLLFTGAISVNEAGSPLIDPNMAKIRYFEPWRNALRHIYADAKSEDEVRSEILGSAVDSSDENDGLKDNLHQLEMLGKIAKKPNPDYDISESQVNAAISYADGYIVIFKNKLELAYTYGQINENEKDILSKIMENYRSTFYGLKDFALWRRFLDALSKQINEYADERKDGLRDRINKQLETNPESSILKEARRLLEEEQNIAVAEEYLNRFDVKQTSLDDVNMLMHESKYYEEFQVLENSLLQECKKDRRLWRMDGGPDDFEKIRDCWPSKSSSNKGEQIKKLFECLGFNAIGMVNRSVISKEEVFKVTVEATPKCQADYIHPIAAFGTQRKTPINVIVLYNNCTPKQLVDTVSSINLRSLSIVLINKAYDAANRRQIGELFHATTGQNPFLLVDLVLFLFLAKHQVTERLPALLNCALPYTTYQPFVRDGGSIPDEMFFGRTQELNTISDLNGTCVVYGGRQLGKTALLERVESLCSKPKDKEFAVYSTIINCKEEKDVVSTLIKDIKRKADGRIKLRECTTIKELCDQLSKLFRNETIVTMHLLIDEVDDFLGAIADQAYKPLQPLVDLRRETRNNFKFVIAGLHNVCRAENATKENGLFGQLGTPLCIKPLSPMDALNLLSRPLSYLGFQIDRNKLETILTNTNYYPGIIQFFGYMLVQTLTGEYQKYYRASDGNPPFTLRDDQLGSVMNSADLNKSIKDKIRLTLELDSRYFMIARCITLLHYYHEGSYGDIYGFKLNEIIDIANEYSIHCLENEKPDEYKNLLAEMEEMGIVCQSEGRYRLRKASFIDIIGENPEVLEQEIEQNNQEA